jgi:hypothetical protein
MFETMKPVRLPEGGRAGLSFAFEGDWQETRQKAMLEATRPNILRHWTHMPEWLRKDQGFLRLMDEFRPMTDEEYELKQAIHREAFREYVRAVLGTRGNPTDDEVAEALRAVPQHNACVDFGVPFGGNTAIATNSTSRTVVGTKTRANQAVRFWGFDIGFDGTTSTNGPGIVEIQQNTFATNAPGTNSTTVTPAVIDFARPETVQSSAAKAWTTEPTVITTVEVFFIPNYMGSGIVFTPLTKPFALAGATGPSGASMRVTQQSGITGNATGALKHEE